MSAAVGIICKSCGMAVPEGRKSCPSCGTATFRDAAAPPDTPDPNSEIHLLLAEANLLRIRGKYEEAIGVCTRLLRADPKNAAAHSLLGDIYLEQHNYREALGWFKLAVQLNPYNAADRRKMEEMDARVYKGDGAKVAAPTAPRPTPAKAPTAPQVKKDKAPEKDDDLDGVIPVFIRWVTGLPPVMIILGCTVLFTVLGLTIVWLTNIGGSSGRDTRPSSQTPVVSETGIGNNNSSGTPTTNASPSPSGTDTSGAARAPAPAGEAPRSSMPVIIPPPPDAVESGQIPGLPGIAVKQPRATPATTPKSTPAPATDPAATGSGSAGTAPLPTVPRTPPASADAGTTPAPEVAPLHPLTDDTPGSTSVANQRAKTLKNAVVADIVQLRIPSTINDVTIDPQSNNVAFIFTVPRMKTALEVKRGLVYTGFHLIWSALRQNSTYPGFVLQGYAPPLNGDGAPSLAFVASITTQQARAAQKAMDYTAVQRFIASPWWRADLDRVSM